MMANNKNGKAKSKYYKKNNSLIEKKNKLYNDKNNKVKVRNLMQKEERHWTWKLVDNCNGVYVILFLVALSILYSTLTREDLMMDIRDIYHSQYGLLVHGSPTYCYDAYNLTSTILELKKKIIGQDNVISNMFEIMNQRNPYKTIALFGSSGVGKTKFVQIIYDQFYWIHNKNYIIFDENFQIMPVLKKLSKCGMNLIIIDDIRSEDIKDIIDINEIFFRNFIASYGEIKVIIIYVMNLSNYNNKLAYYNLSKTAILSMQNIIPVEFRQFDNTDLRKCIDLQSEEFDMELEPEDIAEIMSRIDVRRFGCKQVYSKILLF